MSRAGAARAGLLVAALAGCAGSETGTIALGLATAPGSTVMDGVDRLRLTFIGPGQVFVVDRSARGFDLALDLDASDAVGPLLVEGLDAGGALVAVGQTPPFPLSSINARINVYMAPPMSVGAAPVALEPARSRSSAAPLTYGAVLAGGVTASGAPSDALQIYNAYDHSLLAGLTMSMCPCPEPCTTPSGPRDGVTVATTSGNNVYLFGGTAPGGAATGTLCFFNTNVEPAGRYSRIGDFPQLARTGATAVRTVFDDFLITGAPAAAFTSASKLTEFAGLAPIASGASARLADQTIATIAVAEGSGDLLRIRNGTVEPLGAQRPNALAITLPQDRIGLLGGDAGPRDAMIVNPMNDTMLPRPGVLGEDYVSLVAATTPRFLVVAGRRAGGTETGVEIFDATTLERRGTATVADAITAAIALPNQQVLLIGATLHLFTPPLPSP